ncbi:Hypothetical_protein [Hexamita inflata]|uniref:Hypothetical_protein n=1 Tax=Hexamita inflata TaxID=28002 RepID=A0AA86N8X3_9EUKA|nr:Hypothetical protein HINF_LOCUS2683 [Hexamita inflata]
MLHLTQLSSSKLSEQEQQQMYDYLKSKYDVQLNASGQVQIDKSNANNSLSRKFETSTLMQSQVKVPIEDYSSKLGVFQKIPEYEPLPSRYQRDLRFLDQSSRYQEVEPVVQQELVQQELQVDNEEQKRIEEENNQIQQFGFSLYKLDAESKRLQEAITDMSEQVVQQHDAIHSYKLKLQEIQFETKKQETVNDMLNEQITMTKMEVGRLIGQK